MFVSLFSNWDTDVLYRELSMVGVNLISNCELCFRKFCLVKLLECLLLNCVLSN